MPIIKSAAKALRQSEKRRVANLRVKRAFKATVKELRRQAGAKNIQQARALLPQAYKKIDKAVKKGVIKKNAANRYKSRLSHLLNKLSAPDVPLTPLPER